MAQFPKSVIWITVFAGSAVYGQAVKAAAKPGTDVLIFTDGEKLIGHLVSATNSSVVFKSDMAGELTLDWKNIQELHSTDQFAVVRKGTKVHNKADTKSVPQGAIAVSSQQLTVQSTNAPPQTIPVSDVANVVGETAFQGAFGHPGFAQGWKGGATAGISLTEATQTNQTFTAALNLVRAIPEANWTDLRRRTVFDFNEAYGNLKSPGLAAVKTSVTHFDLEQDWFVSPSVFVFANAAFDHSFSQGLQLQQLYGGGLGLIVFKRPKEEFDFKASADYIDRRFEISTLNKQLVGSIFGETYVRTFAHNILLNEEGGFIPSWNDTSAYSAFASAGLTFPVYHGFGVTLGALENFLNDPPPGFKKNSFQFTAGATYTIK